MNTAFEVTIDDLNCVLEAHSMTGLTDDQVEFIFDTVLDFNDISREALKSNEMDEQTQNALEEIWSQIEHHITIRGITW